MQIFRKPDAGRDPRLYVGVIIILISSIVIGVLNIGAAYLFGAPILILLIGLVLVWFTNISLTKKLLLSAMPFPVILFSFFLMYQLNKAEPETFLIPDTYLGEVVVYYDEPCGQAAVTENGRRVYQFSSNGVLITNSNKNRGFLDRKFYFVNEKGVRTEFPEFRRQKFETEAKEWEFEPIPKNEFTKETVGAFWSYGSETYFISRDSFSYLISNYRDFETDQHEHWMESKRLAKAAKALLKECRETH